MTAEQLDKSVKPKDAAPDRAPDKTAAPASAADQRAAAQKEKARIDRTAGQHVQPVEIDGHDKSKPDTSKPDTSKPDTSKPDTSKPDKRKPAGDTPASAPVAAPQAKPVDIKDMEKTAEAIRKATGDDNYIARWADKDAINNLLKDKSEAERAAIEKIYEQKYHMTLEKQMSFLTGSDRDKFENVLNRKDGNIDSQDTGRIHEALDEHNDMFFGRSGAVLDKDIRDSISGKRADEIKKMNDEYTQKYGCSMRDAIMNNPNVAQETKDMLDTYLKGVDKRTDADTLSLAHATLQAKDEKAFEDVMKGASDTVRKSFTTPEGVKQIKDAFGANQGWGTTALSALIPGYGIKAALDQSHADKAVQHALDVAKDGKIDAATQISDNTGVIKWTTNTKGVDAAIAGMTDDERARYLAGKKLESGDNNAGHGMNDQQMKDAKAYYDQMHTALSNAGDATAVGKWEDEIQYKGGSLVSRLAAHSGALWNDGSGAYAHELENMDKSDWERLKPGSATYDPNYRKQIESMLDSSHCNAETVKRCNEILDEKQKAATFEQAQATAHSSLLDNFSDSEHWYKNDTHTMLDSISKMTPAEQARYQTDQKYRNQVDTAVTQAFGDADAATDDQPEVLQAARDMLAKVAKGEKPDYDIVTNLQGYSSDFLTDRKKAVGDIETALKDDKLRARLNNPQTPEDKAYAAKFETAAKQALGDSYYDKYVTPILKNGHLDIATRLQLDRGFFHNDSDSALKDIAAATPAELKRLKEDPAYREQSIGFLGVEDKKIAQNVIDQGQVKPEDEIRENIAHWGGSSDIMEQLRAVQNDPAKLDQIKSDYLHKYGSDLQADLIGKLSGDDKHEALRILNDHETTDEKYNDARDQFYKSRDGFGNNLVEYVGQSGTGYQLDNAMSNYTQEVDAAHKNFTQVTPEQQSRLEGQFQSTLKNFKETKAATADAIVNGVVAGAAIASLIATGGADAPLLLAMAAGGAMMKVGAKAAIMGGDYDADAFSVTMDCASGAVNGVTSVLGPGECAALFKVGERAALEAASITTRELAEQGATALIKNGAEKTLQKGTAEIMLHTLSSGAQKVDQKAITALAERAVAPGLTGEAKEQAVKQISETLSRNLQSQLQKETATWLTSVGREAALNSGGGALGGGAAGAFDGVSQWDPKKSVGENLESVSEAALKSAFTGGAMGGGMTMGMKAFGHGLASTHGLFRSSESAASAVRLPEGARLSPSNPAESIRPSGVSVPAEFPNSLEPPMPAEAVKVPAAPQSAGLPIELASAPDASGFQSLDAKVPDAHQSVPEAVPAEAPQSIPRSQAGRARYDAHEPAPSASPADLPEGLFHARTPFDGGQTLIYTPKIAEPPAALGDRVLANGQSYTMRGVESSGKYAILGVQGDLPAPISKTISRADFDNQYSKLGSNSDPRQSVYYRDRQGNMFTATSGRDGNVNLESVPQFKAVPASEVKRPPINGPEEDNVFTVNGKSAQFRDGSFDVGRKVDSNAGNVVLGNSEVSGQHGRVSWDRNQEKYFYQDLGSRNGSEVKHAGSNQWEAVPRGGKVEFKQGDQIRLAHKDDSIIKMSGKPAKEFPNPDDVQIYVGNQPVQLRDGQVAIGRAERADGRTVMNDTSVSNRHGSLSYDSADGAFYYTDTNSTNGTYLRREGSNDFVRLTPRQRVRVGASDEIRIGYVDGPQLKLVPFSDSRVGPITQARDLAVTVDGKNLGLSNGSVEIGRSHPIGDSQSIIQDKRVSREHGSLRWDESHQALMYRDHSTFGTYIKRDGTNTWEKLSNRETSIGVNDQVHLGSVDGPQLKLADARMKSAVQDSQAFFGGAPLDMSSGSVEIGRNYQAFSNNENDALNKLVSNDHGTLKWNGDKNAFTYTDHSTNGSYLKRQGSNTFVRLSSDTPVQIGKYDELRLGGEAGPQVKLTQSRGEVIGDGRVRFNRPDGTVIRNADGSEIFSDGAGIRLERNAQGQILNATDPVGFHTEYSYDSKGQPNRIDYSNGEYWKRLNDNQWEINKPNGARTVETAKISIEHDGAIRFKQSGGDTIYNVDQSVEIHKPNGRVEYQSANLGYEQHRLNALAERKFTNVDQKRRFVQLVSDFQKRAAATGLSANEQALTYHQINRLMLAGADAPISLGERVRLSEQIMHEAAYPTQIDQGRNPTCNVATVENRIFTREPDKAARLIVDVATTGKYVTAKGTLIDLTRVPGGVRPDTEALGGLANQFERGSLKDIKVDSQRNWAGQIFEQTAANIKWADTPEFHMKPGDVVMYTKQEGKESARLMKYSPTADGRMSVTPITDSPNIYTPELTKVHNEITGGNDSDFVIVGPGRSVGNPGEARGVNSVAQFENALRDIKSKKQFPAIVMVDARNEPFKKFINSDGHTSAWHVVNIQDIKTDPRTGKMTVEVSNQWGEKANHLGDRAIPADQLFKATISADAQPGQAYARDAYEAAAASPARPTDYRFDAAPERESPGFDGDAGTTRGEGDRSIKNITGDSSTDRLQIKPTDKLDPARIRQVSSEIAQKMQDKPMTGEQFSQMFEKMSPEDRTIATELLEHSAANMNSRALDGQLVDLAKKMEANHSGSVTVYTLSADTSGNPLAYLFRKNNPNLEVNIKILDPSALKQLGDQAGGGSALIFDDLSKATPEQKAFLAKQKNLTVADLGGFDKGMNLWDFGATKYAGPQLMESKLAGLTKEVKDAMAADPSLTIEEAIDKTSNEQILAAAKEIVPNAEVVRPDFDSNRELRAGALDSQKQIEDDLYREFTEPLVNQQQISDFLGSINAKQQAAAAIVLRDGTTVNHYSTMMDQMRSVQDKILAQTGAKPEDLIIVNSFDSNGSAYLVDSLYGKVNGLKPSQYMSIADVRAAAKGSLNGKVLVYLDDVTYSGKQAYDAIAANAREMKQSGARVAVGTLGSYEVPDAKNYWTLHTRNTGDTYQQVKRLNPTVVTGTTYPSFYSASNGDLAQIFRDNPALLSETAGRSDWSKSSVDSAMVLPYGGPNNNISLLNELLRRASMPGTK